MYASQIKDIEGSIIPDPKGYKLLVAIPAIEEKTEGGIIRPDELRRLEACRVDLRLCRCHG